MDFISKNVDFEPTGGEKHVKPTEASPHPWILPLPTSSLSNCQYEVIGLCSFISDWRLVRGGRRRDCIPRAVVEWAKFAAAFMIWLAGQVEHPMTLRSTSPQPASG